MFKSIFLAASLFVVGLAHAHLPNPVAQKVDGTAVFDTIVGELHSTGGMGIDVVAHGAQPYLGNMVDVCTLGKDAAPAINALIVTLTTVKGGVRPTHRRLLFPEGYYRLDAPIVLRGMDTGAFQIPWTLVGMGARPAAQGNVSGTVLVNCTGAALPALRIDLARCIGGGTDLGKECSQALCSVAATVCDDVSDCPATETCVVECEGVGTCAGSTQNVFLENFAVRCDSLANGEIGIQIESPQAEGYAFELEIENCDVGTLLGPRRGGFNMQWHKVRWNNNNTGFLAAGTAANGGLMTRFEDCLFRGSLIGPCIDLQNGNEPRIRNTLMEGCAGGAVRCVGGCNMYIEELHNEANASEVPTGRYCSGDPLKECHLDSVCPATQTCNAGYQFGSELNWEPRICSTCQTGDKRGRPCTDDDNCGTCSTTISMGCEADSDCPSTETCAGGLCNCVGGGCTASGDDARCLTAATTPKGHCRGGQNSGAGCGDASDCQGGFCNQNVCENGDYDDVLGCNNFGQVVSLDKWEMAGLSLGGSNAETRIHFNSEPNSANVNWNRHDFIVISNNAFVTNPSGFTTLRIGRMTGTAGTLTAFNNTNWKADYCGGGELRDCKVQADVFSGTVYEWGNNTVREQACSTSLNTLCTVDSDCPSTETCLGAIASNDNPGFYAPNGRLANVKSVHLRNIANANNSAIPQAFGSEFKYALYDTPTTITDIVHGKELQRQTILATSGDITWAHDADKIFLTPPVDWKMDAGESITFIYMDKDGDADHEWVEIGRTWQDQYLTLPVDDVTPSVSGTHYFKTASTTPTLIQDFTEPYNGQTITILQTETDTDYDCTTSELTCSTAADIITAAPDDILVFTYIGTQWHLVTHQDNSP